MKLIYFFLAVLLVGVTACTSNNKSTPNKEFSGAANLVTVELAVNGMTCEGCEATIAKSLEKMEGVESVSASHVDSTAIVVFDSHKVTTALLAEEIDGLGYAVVGEKISP